jgi:transcriptional regulator with XRE-family HTH domain
MAKNAPIPVDLQRLGRWLLKARRQQGLTQKEVAVRVHIAQPRISAIEKGDALPTLPQLIRLAHALHLPLEWFLRGALLPGREPANLALQLHSLGMVDLFVPEARVPGAFLRTEQVLVAAVRGKQPDPRIVEAIPAIMAWRRWSPARLRGYSKPRRSRETIRLAWLGDVALTIHRTYGFPGGCPQQKHLEEFVGPLSQANLSLTNDDLGHPGEEATLPPVSKRWKISYDAPLKAFMERAQHLHRLLEQQRPWHPLPAKPPHE